MVWLLPKTRAYLAHQIKQKAMECIRIWQYSALVHQHIHPQIQYPKLRKDVV
jgi:hypothetical protein